MNAMIVPCFSHNKGLAVRIVGGGKLVTQNRHLMGIKHNIRPLYALLSASL